MAHIRIHIPACNEYSTIESVVVGCLGLSEKICDGDDRLSIVVVDDGSRDSTSEIVKRVSSSDSRVNIINFSENMGLGIVFREGVKNALNDGVDFFICIDADGQFDPEQAVVLLDAVRSGECDVALGSRFLPNSQRHEITLAKRIGNAIISKIVSKISRQKFYDVSCGLRCFNAQTLKHLTPRAEFTYTHESILQSIFGGFKVKEFPIRATPRKHGQSKIAASLFRYALKSLAIIRRTCITRRADIMFNPDFTFAGKKVLVLSSSYPFHEQDFHALFVHEMATSLAKSCESLTVLTPSVPEQQAANEELEGVHVKRFAYSGCKSFLAVNGRDGMLENIQASPFRVFMLPLFFMFMLGNLFKTVRKEKPDIIISHWLLPSGLAAALVCPKTPTIYYAHSSEVHLLNKIPFGKLLTSFICKDRLIVSPSKFLKDKIHSLYSRANVACIPLGVCLPKDISAKKDNPSKLCYLGRLVPGKGLKRLIEAMKLLPNCSLEICGSGILEQELKELSRDINVKISPPVLGKDKREFFCRNDIFMQVSDVAEKGFQDNLPVTSLEALSYGLPVIATSFGGMPELAAKTDAVIISDPSAEKIAQTIQDVIARENFNHLRTEALETSKDFSWDSHHEALLRNIILR